MFAALVVQLPLPGAAETPSAAAPPADARAVREPVDRLYAVLLDVLKHADALGFEGRYRAIEPASERATTSPSWRS